MSFAERKSAVLVAVLLGAVIFTAWLCVTPGETAEIGQKWKRPGPSLLLLHKAPYMPRDFLNFSKTLHKRWKGLTTTSMLIREEKAYDPYAPYAVEPYMLLCEATLVFYSPDGEHLATKPWPITPDEAAEVFRARGYEPKEIPPEKPYEPKPDDPPFVLFGM